MSFFTDPGINDESNKFWGGNPWFETDPEDGRMPKQRSWNPNQLELELKQFFPLTEQIPLGLDYGASDLLSECYNSKYTVTSTASTVATNLIWSNTVVTNIAPQLTITPIDSVGELSIGGIRVGLENTPKWYQKVLYKLLGFNWKNK